MDRADNIPHVSQDPRDPDFYNHSYDFYRKIRAMGDFVYWEDYELVMATTHVANTSLLRHPKLGRKAPSGKESSFPSHLRTFEALERNSLLELEPPNHTRLRQAALRGFDRKQVAALAPLVSQTADALISAFPSGPFDFIKAFARPLPAIVITRFFGLPEDVAPQLQDWSNDMVAMYQNRHSREVEDRAEQAAVAFSHYLNEAIEGRGKVPGQDFLSDLILAEADGHLASRDELLSTVVLLLNAGHEATVHTLGHAVHHLVNYPERSLALDPTYIANTAEECLRFTPPLHMFQRYVYEDVRIMDHDFEAGQSVGCLLGSACRDDALWPDAEKFDPFRNRRSNLAFGSGIHACLGASLARLELQIALPAVFSRCPDLRITEEPRLADSFHFHGLERLMVEVR